MWRKPSMVSMVSQHVEHLEHMRFIEQFKHMRFWTYDDTLGTTPNSFIHSFTKRNCQKYNNCSFFDYSAFWHFDVIPIHLRCEFTQANTHYINSTWTFTTFAHVQLSLIHFNWALSSVLVTYVTATEVNYTRFWKIISSNFSFLQLPDEISRQWIFVKWFFNKRFNSQFSFDHLNQKSLPSTQKFNECHPKKSFAYKHNKNCK